MEVQVYTSVQLSSRERGGLMLRLVMMEGTLAPRRYAAELILGGYLIFERVSEPAVGVAAVYEAVRAVENLDPDGSVLVFKPVPKIGGSSGVIAETCAAFDKMHDDRLKGQQIVASLLGSLSEEGRLSRAREDFLTREAGDDLRGIIPHAIYLMEMRTLVERRISGMISQSEFLQQAASLINAGLTSPQEPQS